MQPPTHRRHAEERAMNGPVDSHRRSVLPAAAR